LADLRRGRKIKLRHGGAWRQLHQSRALTATRFFPPRGHWACPFH
jgi:hypothetical protein